MSGIKLVNVSNPAAFGVQWPAETGATYQLVNPRGTATLLMGMRPEGSGTWHTMRVDEPSRFGVTSPLGSFSDLVKAAERFVNED